MTVVQNIVEQVGPSEYELDRKLLDNELLDLSVLGREARVIPNYDRESGTYVGFKLIGVRPNSLYRAMGIRSGDIILKINDEEMHSPSKALELFVQLQNSDKVVLLVKRRGEELTLAYTIQ